MTIDEIAYTTRERVQAELATAGTYVDLSRIDTAVYAAARNVEGLTHRYFYPTLATRTFDMPTDKTLWLYEHELAALPTSIVSGTQTMGVGDYIAQPLSGPPYRWLDVNYGGDVPWSSGTTTQRSISITGQFGYCNDERPAGQLIGSITAADTSATVSDSSVVGVGDLIRIGAERIAVTGKTTTATGLTLAADLAAGTGATVVAISGTGLRAGETLVIDGEQMLVTVATGSSAIVRRAYAGSVLAGHTAGATIYSYRSVTLSRAQAGTTAATHSGLDAITANRPPSLITLLNLAYAVNSAIALSTGYSRPVGSDQSTRAQSGRGIPELEEDVYTRYGRKTRSRAVGS